MLDYNKFDFFEIGYFVDLSGNHYLKLSPGFRALLLDRISEL